MLRISALKANFYTFFAGWCEANTGKDYWSIVSWETEIEEVIYREMPNLLLALEWAYEDEACNCVLLLAKTIVHPIHRQGYVDKRIKYSQYALEAARTMGVIEDEAWFMIDGLGLVYYQSGDHEEAKTFVLCGMELAREHKLLDALALGEVLLSSEASRTGQLSIARKHADEALKYAQSSYLKYRTHRTAGHVARHEGNYEQAEKYYHRAADFLQGKSYRSTVDLYIGLTKLGLEQYEEAETYFRKALEIHRQYGNQRVIARAKLGLAQIYTVRIKKLLREVSELTEAALEVFSQMNLQRELEQTVELKEHLAKISTTVA